MVKINILMLHTVRIFIVSVLYSFHLISEFLTVPPILFAPQGHTPSYTVQIKILIVKQLNDNVDHEFPEAVAQACSVKKVFLEISQNS